MSQRMIRYDDGDTVAVRTPEGKELWSHELTGAPLIDYVPAQAFHMVDSGEAVICIEKSPDDE